MVLSYNNPKARHYPVEGKTYVFTASNEAVAAGDDEAYLYFNNTTDKSFSYLGGRFGTSVANLLEGGELLLFSYTRSNRLLTSTPDADIFIYSEDSNNPNVQKKETTFNVGKLASFTPQDDEFFIPLSELATFFYTTNQSTTSVAEKDEFRDILPKLIRPGQSFILKIESKTTGGLGLEQLLNITLNFIEL